MKRFGFAYGTLEDHAESGEERFLVEWNRENDEVWYDLLAFSRPNQFLSRTGYPFTRRAQKKFERLPQAAPEPSGLRAPVSRAFRDIGFDFRCFAVHLTETTRYSTILVPPSVTVALLLVHFTKT